MDGILLQFEQQLAASSALLSVPASVVVAAASITLIGVTVVSTMLLRRPGSEAPDTSGNLEVDSGSGGNDASLSASAGLPAPEQLARLIQVLRSPLSLNSVSKSSSDPFTVG